MGSYIPAAKEEQLQMLMEIGMDSFEDLYCDIPERLKFKGELDIPEGISELELYRKMRDVADKNKTYKHIFRGAGSYNHYIPAIVKQVTSKEEFVTAYTPYQAEISQGILQSIFEYQTMICTLTGMSASNASVYDGATAAAEGCAMCLTKKKRTVAVSACADPKLISVVKTYCFGNGAELIIIPESEGKTDMDFWMSMDTSDTACLLVQSPNYYGIIEDCTEIAQAVHAKGAKFIMSCNPIALGLLKTPGECGADVAVGEGQPLGLPMAFGGPYLGYMAASEAMMRSLPGRIVGQTEDVDGKRAFVLTMQAREQHIRREKAGSNICSNEALCAMTAAVYLSAVGSAGLENIARQCASNAHYLKERLSGLGLSGVYDGEFFHEFVTECPVDADELISAIKERDFLPGLKLEGNRILWCATEMNSRDEIDTLCSIIKEAIG